MCIRDRVLIESSILYRKGRNGGRALLSKTTTQMEDRQLRLVRSADDLPRPAHFHPRDSFVPRRHDHSTPHIASRNAPHTDSQCQWNADLIGVVGNWLSRVQNASLVMNVNDIAYALCAKY